MSKPTVSSSALTPWDRTRDIVVKYGFIAVTVVLIAYFWLTIERFGMSSTIFSMLKNSSTIAIAGLGLTITMVVGGMDLSVGAGAGMAVTLAATTMVIWDRSGGMAIGVVLVAGALIGLVNGLLIVVLKIPDLLATLGMMFVIQGLKLVPVKGQSVSSGMRMRDGTVASGSFSPSFIKIDSGRQYIPGLGQVPVPVILVVVLTIGAWIFLTRTKWGRVMYAIGANPEAARLAGLRVGAYKAAAYTISGVFAAIAGLILAARIRQGDISAGNSLLLDAVAVSLVGTSVLGIGKPNAWGTALGAILLGVVAQGLTMNNVSYYWQDVAKGVVVLVALILAFTMSRRKSRYVPAV